MAAPDRVGPHGQVGGRRDDPVGAHLRHPQAGSVRRVLPGPVPRRPAVILDIAGAGGGPGSTTAARRLPQQPRADMSPSDCRPTARRVTAAPRAWSNGPGLYSMTSGCPRGEGWCDDRNSIAHARLYVRHESLAPPPPLRRSAISSERTQRPMSDTCRRSSGRLRSGPSRSCPKSGRTAPHRPRHPFRFEFPATRTWPERRASCAARPPRHLGTTLSKS